MNAYNYTSKLSALATMYHARNPALVGIALCGLSCGKMPFEIAQDIADNCGAPPLSETEIRRAVEKAESIYQPNAKRETYSINIAKNVARTANIEERSFVASHVGENASMEDLQRISPVDVACMDQVQMAKQYVATVFPDDRHFVFSCKDTELKHKRTFDSLKYPSVLYRSITSASDIPSFAIANQFTGYEGENGSYACTSTLITRRLTLVEFDSMPLEKQASFWMSMITGGKVPGLRTLVYSGSKSIHALLRMKDSYEQSAGEDVDAAGFNVTVYDRERAKAAWENERDELQRVIESSDDPSMRCDKACKDPTRLTRFAGAMRTLKDGSRRVQRLLWCQFPNIDADVPIYDGEDCRLCASDFEEV